MTEPLEALLRRIGRARATGAIYLTPTPEGEWQVSVQKKNSPVWSVVMIRRDESLADALRRACLEAGVDFPEEEDDWSDLI